MHVSELSEFMTVRVSEEILFLKILWEPKVLEIVGKIVLSDEDEEILLFRDGLFFKALEVTFESSLHGTCFVISFVVESGLLQLPEKALFEDFF